MNDNSSPQKLAAAIDKLEAVDTMTDFRNALQSARSQLSNDDLVALGATLAARSLLSVLEPEFTSIEKYRGKAEKSNELHRMAATAGLTINKVVFEYLSNGASNAANTRTNNT